MNTITLKVTDELIEQFLPVAEALKKEGNSDASIKQSFQDFIQKKNKAYYKKKDCEEIGLTLHKLAGNFEAADSKTEKIFYELLVKNNINFNFQYKIGKYRADFLIAYFLVVELDGPLHDKIRDDIRDRYMQKMGYQVFRIPVYVLIKKPLEVIKEIKSRINKSKYLNYDNKILNYDNKI